MKKILLLLLVVLGGHVSADPQSALGNSLQLLGQPESALKQYGAVQSGKDIDLRPALDQVLKIYIWLDGNVEYVATTNNQVISLVSSYLQINGDIQSSPFVVGSYKTDEEFKTDVATLTSVVAGYRGRSTANRESFGVRTNSYNFLVGNTFSVDINVFTQLEDAEAKGFGWISIEVKRLSRNTH